MMKSNWEETHLKDHNSGTIYDSGLWKKYLFEKNEKRAVELYSLHVTAVSSPLGKFMIIQFSSHQQKRNENRNTEIKGHGILFQTK